MKFVIDMTIQPGVDPTELADNLLDILCHLDEDSGVDGIGIDSFDSIDPVRE